MASLVVGYAADALTGRHLVHALWLGPVSAQAVAVVVLCARSGVDSETAMMSVWVIPVAAVAGCACTAMVLLAHGLRRLRTAS